MKHPKREHWKFEGRVMFSGLECYLWTRKRKGLPKEKWHVTVDYYRRRTLGR
jgi:hypothetical protein